MSILAGNGMWNGYRGGSKPLPKWQMGLGVAVLAVLLSPLLIFNLLPPKR